jgi:OPA family glycerol-3-phosphate transporter-like MFS transporter
MGREAGHGEVGGGCVAFGWGALPTIGLARGETETVNGLILPIGRRRFFNWFPLGLTYAFLYFGRYNLSAMQPDLDKLGLLTKAEFGNIDGFGSIVYGLAFLLNGPLTDRWGGRTTILIASLGSAAMNAAMGFIFIEARAGALDAATLVNALTLAFSANMYFQSFGAVSIVKVNAPWFHTRERGVLGGVFGILISLGLYFAYDLTLAIAHDGPAPSPESLGARLPWVFFIPAAVLLAFFLIDYFAIRDTPGQAGHRDFDTGDATQDDAAGPPSLLALARRMFAQRVIWIIVAIEFCSGFLRNAVMKWYRAYAKDVGAIDSFVYANWGLVTCIAGILGGVFAGTISDHVFGSRRGPVSAVLYGGLLVGAIVSATLLGTPALGWAVAFMSLCVIGVHGMLSGTASADFGGKKGAGMATGIIDGFVYLGTATQAFVYGQLLPKGPLAKDAANWLPWPVAMIPVAIVGLLLATRVWNARPSGSSSGH